MICHYNNYYYCHKLGGGIIACPWSATIIQRRKPGLLCSQQVIKLRCSSRKFLCTIIAPLSQLFLGWEGIIAGEQHRRKWVRKSSCIGQASGPWYVDFSSESSPPAPSSFGTDGATGNMLSPWDIWTQRRGQIPMRGQGSLQHKWEWLLALDSFENTIPLGWREGATIDIKVSLGCMIVHARDKMKRPVYLIHKGTKPIHPTQSSLPFQTLSS